MKAVCEALGLARSHIHNLKHRPASWSDGRKARVLDDSELVAEVRQQLAELPSYGYRRACALVNRQRVATDQARINAKRVYRVMAAHKLLLPRAPRLRHFSRPHSGKVGVEASNMRWCSDGFEIRCDSGPVVTATFVKDCCDREVMALRAWVGKGLPGEPVRDMLDRSRGEALRRCGRHPGTARAGGPVGQRRVYIALDTRQIARALGLMPSRTPVSNPLQQWHRRELRQLVRPRLRQSLGPERSGNVLAQLPAALEHFNEIHPHSSLKTRLPHGFGRQRSQAFQWIGRVRGHGGKTRSKAGCFTVKHPPSEASRTSAR